MAAHLEDTSRHRIQCAIKEGYVRIGDIPVKANQIVRPGDVITILAGCKHRVRALSELTIIEVQLGDNITVHDKKKYEE